MNNPGGTPAADDLTMAAEDVWRHAYAPYSRFAVGAAVRTTAKGVYAGCNVENGSYGLTMCAERAAIFAAVAAEGPTCRVTELVVVAGGEPAPPCGACRQVLAEFGPDALVSYPMPGGVRTKTLNELLPDRFGLGDAGDG